MVYRSLKKFVVGVMLAGSLYAAPLLAQQPTIPPAIAQIATAMGARSEQEALAALTALQAAQGNPEQLARVVNRLNATPITLRNMLRDLDQASFEAVSQLAGLASPEAWNSFFRAFDQQFIDQALTANNLSADQIRAIAALPPDEQVAAAQAAGLNLDVVSQMLFIAGRSTAGEALGITEETAVAFLRAQGPEAVLQYFGLNQEQLNALVALDPADPAFAEQLRSIQGFTPRGAANLLDALQESDQLAQALEASGLDEQTLAEELSALRIRNFETERPGAEVLANQPEDALLPAEYLALVASGELAAWGAEPTTEDGAEFEDDLTLLLDEDTTEATLEEFEALLGDDLDAALAELLAEQDELLAEIEARQAELAAEDALADDAAADDAAADDAPADDAPADPAPADAAPAVPGGAAGDGAAGDDAPADDAVDDDAGGDDAGG